MNGMSKLELTELGALELRARVLRGEISAVDVAKACLESISRRDDDIGAWVHLDEALVISQAEALDRQRQMGQPLGSLHGLPVGVKDIIDTADLPTENGALMDAGRRPSEDAAIVRRLRAAGAIVLGKTVTTECAHFAPGKTRNPFDSQRTPGGSSSGSAAAVAAHMVPLSIGTQTAGSVIRPASFCGVVGFKPSFGQIPRTGVLQHSPWLDTIGTFSRSVEDAALLSDVLAGHDPGDPESNQTAPPALLATAQTEPPVTPALAFVKNTVWDQIDEDCAEGFSELVEVLGDCCDSIELPGIYAEAILAQRRLAHVGMARNLRNYLERGIETLAQQTIAAIEDGNSISAVDYLSALDWRNVLQQGLDEIFNRYDAIVTPAAPGEAPVGLNTTGNPAFCVLWTLTGLPAVTLPLLQGRDGMPIGVQLVGRLGYDGRLLRTARWLTAKIRDSE